ncbi:hypothetical protein Godav_018016, partial [Gossypium davidsonii]|nr:hypothetical protein [Gossypium davidsonii]
VVKFNGEFEYGVSSSSSLCYSSPPKLFPLGYNNPNYTLKNPTKTFLFRTSKIAPRSSRIPISAHASPLPPRHPQIVLRKHRDERFASISSSSNQQTSSVGVNPNPTVPPPSSRIHLCLYVFQRITTLLDWSRHWALSTFYMGEQVDAFSRKYAMRQAFKAMMGQMNTQNNQFGNTVFPSGSPFPFPAPPSAGPDIPRSPSFQRTDTVDAPVRQVEAASVTDPATFLFAAFVDVSPKETMHKSAFEDAAELSSPNGVQSSKDESEVSIWEINSFEYYMKLSDNGAASKQDAGAFGGFQASGGAGPTLSVDALEKMLEDPTVQKMVYP